MIGSLKARMGPRWDVMSDKWAQLLEMIKSSNLDGLLCSHIVANKRE